MKNQKLDIPLFFNQKLQTLKRTFFLPFSLLLVVCWKGEAQTLEDFQILHDDSLRTYKLYIPATYTGDEAWPLVITLHGYSLNNDYMIAATEMNAVADTGHFIVAYPQGLLVHLGDGFSPLPPDAPGWNAGQGDDPLLISGNDDVGFLDQMINVISQGYNIDPARIYSCGHSNGGFMSYVLACELPDRITAVASVSGGMLSGTFGLCDPGRSIPVMEIHGSEDPIVPFDGIPGLLQSVPEVVDFWTTNNNCSTEPTITPLPDIDTTDNSTVTLKIWGACDDNAEVWLYEIAGGGHPWPGDLFVPPPFLEHENKDIHASTEIWNFFNRHVKRLGEVVSDTLIYDNMERTYKLYIPAAYTGDEAWPLVITLHGYGLNNDYMIAATEMNAVADTGHFIVAYPQGLLVHLGDGFSPLPPDAPGWNAGQGDDPLLISGNDDVGFLDQMINVISQGYNIDPARIYSCGHSNGGFMSYVLACELPDRITAVASVSGGMLSGTFGLCDPGRSIPVMEIHGSEDPIVPFDGIPGLLQSVPEVVDFWTTNNNCSTEPTITPLPDIDTTDNSTVTLKIWGACDDNAEVWLYEIAGGGHPWPGDLFVPPPFLGPENNDIHASTEIWNFFNRHDLVTAIFKIQLNGILSIHPNPSFNDLTLNLESKDPLHQVEIEIFDLVGKKVKSLVRESFDNSLQEEIRLTGLPEGIYTIRVSSEGKFIAKKFVKMN